MTIIALVPTRVREPITDDRCPGSLWMQPARDRAMCPCRARIAHKIRVRKDERLFSTGDRFTALYVIRSGSCRTIGHLDGRIHAPRLRGDVLGADGINADTYRCSAFALDDYLEACELPFKRIEALARLDEQFQHNLYRLLSREIARAHRLLSREIARAPPPSP
jgi:CRP-like cAMP-binding protein